AARRERADAHGRRPRDHRPSGPHRRCGGDERRHRDGTGGRGDREGPDARPSRRRARGRLFPAVRVSSLSREGRGAAGERQGAGRPRAPPHRAHRRRGARDAREVSRRRLPRPPALGPHHSRQGHGHAPARRARAARGASARCRASRGRPPRGRRGRHRGPAEDGVMAGFTPDILEEIRSRVDIVELVGQWVKLKRAGENWKGLCPFHTEKTPSFTVNPKKGIFHCFGCKAGGDAFSFLRKQERLDFPEAVRALAERAGVTLPADRAERAPDSRLDGLRAVMARAGQFFVDVLWAPGDPGAEKARHYLAGRGVEDEVARRFGLGYAPEGWDNLLGFMRRHGIGEELLSQAGLILPRQNATGFYDRFRGRLMFSIRDAQGRVVAFGGRALGPDEVKYINSPETPLYVKGQTVYGLDLAKPAIRERNRAVVVEGYLDCLMAHQHGFTETVAALGTAFTSAQLALLQRNAEEIVAVFDADAAGQKASARLEEMMTDTMDVGGLAWAVARTGGFERSGYFPVKVAVLPPGHDPDSLLRAGGAAASPSRLDAARSILFFVMQQALSEEDLSTARGRATAHARVALILSKVANAEEAT